MGLPYELAVVASATICACDCTAFGAGAMLCWRVAALELCVLVALDPRHCGASQCGFSTPWHWCLVWCVDIVLVFVDGVSQHDASYSNPRDCVFLVPSRC
jgi:hypothetical protein